MKGNFNQIIQSSRPVLVDFHAEWCQPCKVQSPIIAEVARKMGDRIRVIKIDVDKNPQISTRYQISGVPTLALFKSGRLVWRRAGVTPADQLMAIIQSNL
ncbi:MAG: thioredoxin [Bacteroidales bacterium]